MKPRLAGMMVTAAVSASIGVGPSTGGSAQAAPDRYWEPLVVTGQRLGIYQGQPIDSLGLWHRDADGWASASFQVDQRDAGGGLVAEEGPDVLDGNDELVFLSDALGEAWDGTQPPPGADGRLAPAHLVVTDPLDPAYLGHAYLFTGAAGDSLAGVTFDPASREIHSSLYTLGLASAQADGFVGVARLSLRGDERDLLDRSKIRVTIPTFGTFTEETLAQLGGLVPTEPVIEGPVRLVFSRDGSSMAYAARATLLELQLDREVPVIPGLEFRFSFDFAPEAAGATYRAENLGRAVTIDGSPDEMLQLAFPMWREIEFGVGRLVMLASKRPPPLLVRPYYRDDATTDDSDTGDKMSYGDNGIVANTLDGLIDAGFLGEMVVLPPDGGPSAADLARHKANPLEVEVDVPPLARPIFLPLLVDA